MSDGDQQWALLGFVRGPHGLHGRVQVKPQVDRIEYLTDASQWQMTPRGIAANQGRGYDVLSANKQGKYLSVELAGVNTREQAEALQGYDVYILRDELSEPEPGSFYWNDLKGLEVSTKEGEALGVVKDILATGANDVLVVEQDDQQHLLPFVMDQVVLSVNLEQKTIVVDWDPTW